MHAHAAAQAVATEVWVDEVQRRVATGAEQLDAPESSRRTMTHDESRQAELDGPEVREQVRAAPRLDPGTVPELRPPLRPQRARQATPGPAGRSGT
ncbi:hypothetical protein GCM10010345_23610 [Streptomyces canarius]|uniref:Uncharacterized protein n=1 Tax=Streptomyces canarius TaxID=285453 RepID=A0ABQ3CKZ8_9ACTN|nr:hypothetical protein GCM10010345_23610 [Streptomyces canarius]